MVLDLTLSVRDAINPPSIDNAKAIWTLILFILANFWVIWNPPFRCRTRNRYDDPIKREPLPPYVAPVFVVIVLLCAQVFDRHTLHDGIVGRDGIEPLNIMALFLSLAYMSISLDKSGFFEWLAYSVANRWKSSPRKLYLFFYVLFLGTSTVFGNDPVVLSGTPFLAHFTDVMKVDPTPWIFAQFTTANMASVILVSSNPTNLVVAGAFGISFLSFAIHVLFPFVFTALLVYATLFGIYNSRWGWAYRSPSKTENPESSTLTRSPRIKRLFAGPSPDSVESPPLPREFLLNQDLPTKPFPRSSLVTLALFLLCLVLLVVFSVVRKDVPVWEITVPFAAASFIWDVVWCDVLHRPRTDARTDAMQLESLSHSITANGSTVIDDGKGTRTSDTQRPGSSRGRSGISFAPSRTPSRTRISRTATPISQTDQQRTKRNGCDAFMDWRLNPIDPVMHWLKQLSTRLDKMLPRTWEVVACLPIGLLPFAFAMFTIVQGLATLGWVEFFAAWWDSQVGDQPFFVAIIFMYVITCVLCNFFGTNIGATIFLARLLQVWKAKLSMNDAGTITDLETTRRLEGAIYSLAIAANFGAFSFVFTASLAGLLWLSLLGDGGIKVRQGQFLCLNIPVTFVAMFATCVVLLVQTRVWPR